MFNGRSKSYLGLLWLHLAKTPCTRAYVQAGCKTSTVLTWSRDELTLQLLVKTSSLLFAVPNGFWCYFLLIKSLKQRNNKIYILIISVAMNIGRMDTKGQVAPIVMFRTSVRWTQTGSWLDCRSSRPRCSVFALDFPMAILLKWQEISNASRNAILPLEVLSQLSDVPPV
jgi:hypothetical protein